MKPNKWIKFWIITTIILCILTYIINFIINPYDIYNIDLFNFKKVAIYNKLREIEPIKIKQTKPSSIVLGTSRPKYGIDVSHEYFKHASYNLAIPGGTIYENKQLLKLSIQQGNLKQVLLGLDYIMFSLEDKKEGEITENSGQIKYIVSLDALIDSFKTILEIGDKAVLRNGNVILFNKYKNYANE